MKSQRVLEGEIKDDGVSEQELEQDRRDLARADDDGFALAREEESNSYHE